MDDVRLGEHLEKLKHLAGDITSVWDRQAALLLAEPVECRAFQILHDEEEVAMRLTGIQYLTNARVAELGAQSGFAHQSCRRLGAIEPRPRQYLHGDLDVQRRVTRQVYDPHAATADFPDNPVPTDLPGD